MYVLVYHLTTVKFSLFQYHFNFLLITRSAFEVLLEISNCKMMVLGSEINYHPRHHKSAPRMEIFNTTR